MHPTPNLTRNPSTRLHHRLKMHARITTWYEDCLKGWNATSYMSESDYEHTCLQAARERVEFLDDEDKK